MSVVKNCLCWPRLALSLFLFLLPAGCSVAQPEQYAGGRPEQSQLQPQFTHLNGRQVEYVLQKHGTTTVVFEHGLAGNVYRWDQVFPAIAKDYTALAHSRAGNGLSAPAAVPRDGEHAVEELRQLLRQQGLTPPYVLVGHSLGGLYMQWYARRYPEEVSALVLVDAIFPQISQLLTEDPPLWVRALRLFADWKLVSPRQQVIAEIDQIAATAAAIDRLPPNHQVPLFTLRASEQDFVLPDGYIREQYPQAQEIWLDAGHNLQWEAPAAVIATIRKAIQVSQGHNKSQVP